MASVNFFSAISFEGKSASLTQTLLEKVDSYFYLGGRKACVISASNEVVLREKTRPFFSTILKVASYSIIIIPMFMLIAKAILRSTHRFQFVDPRKRLEEGIAISQETIEKIKALMPDIQNRKENPEITWHASGNNCIFSLQSVPNLIFKTSLNSLNVKQRFANMMKAKKVCLVHQLGLLVIPHARKFKVDGERVIAEERLNINPNASAQEHFYQLSGLNETAKQLATFIVKTGFSDVEWRNMPLLDTASQFPGHRRVVLIDLEEMTRADTGIFGSEIRRGLIGCLGTEEQIDIALDVAARHGVVSEFVTPQQGKAKRMAEIQRDHELELFHMRNGILENPRKPIHVEDLTTFDLNLDEQDYLTRMIDVRGPNGEYQIEYRRQYFVLRAVIVDVIAKINDAMRKTPENASIKGKRYFLLKVNDLTMFDYMRLGLPKNRVGIYTEQEIGQAWLRKIINALIEKGHLFKLNVDDYGYFVQA